MSELPTGWATARLDEVAIVSGGIQKQPSRAPRNHTAPFLRVANVGSGSLDLDDVHEIEISPDELERYQLQQGDLLVVEGNGSASQIGRAARWRGEIDRCVHQNHLMRVRPSPAVSPQYLEYLWMSPTVRENVRARAASTSGLFVLTTKKISGVDLPIAPSREQERIVRVIDEAFSKLDAGEAGMRAGRQLLKRTREAILAAAVTGQLAPQDGDEIPAARILADLGIEPVDPGEGSRVPDGWSSVRLADIARVGSGTTPKRGRSEYWEDGNVPWVASGALNAGVVTEPTEYVTELALRETSLRLWPAGTLLVAMYGEGQTRGRCAELAIEATCNQACAAIALRPELADYKQTLRLHFDANYSANRRLAAGGVQPNLSGALIKEMVVALPPPEEAGRIVAEVERQMSFIEACERSVDAGLEVSAALRRSVLRAAFEGRLVPQEPTDEPASVLLERIRAERDAGPKPKKRRARATA